MIEDDTHDKLTKAYIEYYKANEKWETRRSVRTYYTTQQKLREIQKLSKAKQKENKTLFDQIHNRNKK